MRVKIIFCGHCGNEFLGYPSSVFCKLHKDRKKLFQLTRQTKGKQRTLIWKFRKYRQSKNINLPTIIHCA